MKNKGKIATKVDSQRAIEHLDPTSKTHRKDQKASKERQAYLSRIGPLIQEIPLKAQFPSLGYGIMMTPEGTELSSIEHDNLLNLANRKRKVYYMEQTRPDGRTYQRKRETDPIHQMAVLFLPGNALALMRLENEHGYRTRLFVKSSAIKVAKAFQEATGYEALAIQIHPKEGCLHFHITYATVTESAELIHARYQRGRHGQHLLGPALIGALRLGELGLLPADKWKQAQYYLNDRRQSNGGDDPIDWRMCEMLDGLCAQFAENKGIEVQRIFDDAESDYAALFSSGELMTRNGLVERVAALEREKEARDSEIAELKAKNANLQSTLSSVAIPPTYKSFKPDPKRSEIGNGLEKTTFEGPEF